MGEKMFNERFGNVAHACYKSNLHCVVHALGINQFFKWHAAPPSPSDPAVKKAADRLASFVAKNGRQIEDITRQKNPGNTPFRYVVCKLFFVEATHVFYVMNAQVPIFSMILF